MLKFFAEHREVLVEAMAIVIVPMVVILTRRRPSTWMRTVERGLHYRSAARIVDAARRFSVHRSSVTLSLWTYA
jgi:hypothetical protein